MDLGAISGGTLRSQLWFPTWGLGGGLTKTRKTHNNRIENQDLSFGIHMAKNDEKHMPEAMEGVLGSQNDFKT